MGSERLFSGGWRGPQTRQGGKAAPGTAAGTWLPERPSGRSVASMAVGKASSEPRIALDRTLPRAMDGRRQDAAPPGGRLDAGTRSGHVLGVKEGGGGCVMWGSVCCAPSFPTQGVHGSEGGPQLAQAEGAAAVCSPACVCACLHAVC